MARAKAHRAPAGPQVSVIVPVYNDAGRLRLCLEALGRQDFPGRVEVLVVDNGSADDVAGALTACPGARLLHEPRPGSYAARNRGLVEARGALLAFTDADCQPAPGWLAAGVRRLQATDRPDLVGGHVEMFAVDRRRPRPPELFDLAFEIRQERLIAEFGYAATANLFTRRSVVDRFGPFEAGRLSSGDAEWCRRVGAGGGAIVYEPAAVVRHPARRSWRELVRKTRRHIGGLDASTARHLGRGWLVLRAVAALVTPLASLRYVPLGWRLAGWRGAFGLYAANVVVDAVRLGEYVRLRLGGKPRR